eukprot:NODE_7436_length_440_cov_139.212987.p3 GENE.NODE_7436_length_440_cov_139.212987~~NODE_7436_length_440_cov_139.212987.p3  ORF type:complete len:101 (+),score=27.29 NODE_7436_length_440_cov_139.212987:3-305(+)
MGGLLRSRSMPEFGRTRTDENACSRPADGAAAEQEQSVGGRLAAVLAQGWGGVLQRQAQAPSAPAAEQSPVPTLEQFLVDAEGTATPPPLPPAEAGTGSG